MGIEVPVEVVPREAKSAQGAQEEGIKSQLEKQPASCRVICLDTFCMQDLTDIGAGSLQPREPIRPWEPSSPSLAQNENDIEKLQPGNLGRPRDPISPNFA